MLLDGGSGVSSGRRPGRPDREGQPGSQSEATAQKQAS